MIQYRFIQKLHYDSEITGAACCDAMLDVLKEKYEVMQLSGTIEEPELALKFEKDGCFFDAKKVDFCPFCGVPVQIEVTIVNLKGIETYGS